MIYRLGRGEKVIADRGYRGSHWHITPDDKATRIKKFERMKSVVRARHETVNRRFKEFGCMKQKWRHPRRKHGMAFRAVANVVQTKIVKEKLAFKCRYNDKHYLHRR